MNYQILLKAENEESFFLQRMQKCIPKKMQCGLIFQHLPESIRMVRRYEVVTEQYKEDILKKINAAKLW